jgi:hypothetical protein
MAFHEFTNEWTPLPRATACQERPAKRPAGYRSSNIAKIRHQGVGVETGGRRLLMSNPDI